MKKNTHIIVIFFNIFFVLTNTMNGNDSDVLNKTTEKIHKEFIDIETSEVIKLQKKDRPLEKKFQEYLKNDSLMQKVIQTNQEGTGEFATKVVLFSQNIEKDLEAKGDQLIDEYGWSIRKKDWSLIGIVGGTALVAASCFYKNTATGIGGSIAIVGGGYGYYENSKKVNTIPTHIKVVYSMEEKWKQSFEQQQKDQ
jgi:hypothetical protein